MSSAPQTRIDPPTSGSEQTPAYPRIRSAGVQASGQWWPCFVCASEAECGHREAELIEWMRGGPPADIVKAALLRKPPGRETERAA